MVAAAETQGVTMGGNFGEMLGTAGGITLTLNADGTGRMTYGEEASDVSWAPESNDAIYVTPQSTNGFAKQEAILVAYKNDALFMPFEQDGRQMTLIFTRDGNYAGAKQINLADAKPITSESALLGTWTPVGINMGGISIYGGAESMAAALGGTQSTVTFKEGGAVEMDAGEGTWAVGADGATLTSTDVTGTNTVPIVALGDEVALDYSAAYGMEFIILMAKA